MPDYLEKFKKLPAQIQDFYVSSEPTIAIKKSLVLFGLDSKKSSSIVGEIGLMYVSDLRISDLPKIIFQKIKVPESVAYGVSFEINRRIFNKFPEYFKDSQELLDQWSRLKSNSVMSEEEVLKKVLELEPWILELEKEERQNAKTEKENEFQKQASLTKLTLSDALKKFPEVGEQLITGNKIKLKNFPEPARPSIKNWLSDYTFNLGYDPHDSITRSSYLFQNENAKILNSTDRQKLGSILKAYDENSQISVNINTKQIVFSQAEQGMKHGTWNMEQNTRNMEHGTWNTEQETRNLPTGQAGNKQETNNYAPKDIFENREENKQKFFDGHIVQGRQWTNLPEKTQSMEHGTYSMEQNSQNMQPATNNQQQSYEVPHFDMRQKPEAPVEKKSTPLKTEFPRYENKQVEFSSPQKMPYESDQQQATNNLRHTTNDLRSTAKDPQPLSTPQPMRITPSGFNRNTYNHSDNNPQSKNVVNLKDNS